MFKFNADLVNNQINDKLYEYARLCADSYADERELEALESVLEPVYGEDELWKLRCDIQSIMSDADNDYCDYDPWAAVYDEVYELQIDFARRMEKAPLADKTIASVAAERWPVTVKRSMDTNAVLIEQQGYSDVGYGGWIREILVVGDNIVDISDGPEDYYSDKEWDAAWEAINRYFPQPKPSVEPHVVKPCDIADEDIPF